MQPVTAASLSGRHFCRLTSRGIAFASETESQAARVTLRGPLTATAPHPPRGPDRGARAETRGQSTHGAPSSPPARRHTVRSSCRSPPSEAPGHRAVSTGRAHPTPLPTSAQRPRQATPTPTPVFLSAPVAHQTPGLCYRQSPCLDVSESVSMTCPC